MSFSYGFYNSLNGDRKYNAIQISQLFDGLINDGMYATVGKCMMVRESGKENKVIVGSGRGWFNHTWNYNDADILLNCTPSDLVKPRIDAVVLDINRYETFRENSIKYIVGIPNNNPTKPALTKSGTHFQYPLAYITRAANSTKITQANIENAVGTSACPFVTGIIKTISTDDLIDQWQAQWTTLFEDLKDVLDENAAVHLQNEINDIESSIRTINNSITGINGSINTINTSIQRINKSLYDINATLTIIKSTLPAGSTSITISDSRITTNSALSFYTSIYGVNPTAVSVANGSVTLTFDAQTVAIQVGVSVDG